jgi:hypothetical protein
MWRNVVHLLLENPDILKYVCVLQMPEIGWNQYGHEAVLYCKYCTYYIRSKVRDTCKPYTKSGVYTLVLYCTFMYPVEVEGRKEGR